MAKSQDAKKTEKKEPLKTAKEKKEEKRIKKNILTTRIAPIFTKIICENWCNSCLFPFL